MPSHPRHVVSQRAHAEVVAAFLRACRVVLCAGSWALGAGGTSADVHAEELRDPFVFGPREGAKTQAGGRVLMGVLWDAMKPLAIVGDETVGVGDVVDNWQVVQIQQNGIVIQRGERRETISIGNSLPTD